MDLYFFRFMASVQRMEDIKQTELFVERQTRSFALKINFWININISASAEKNEMIILLEIFCCGSTLHCSLA